MLHGNFSDFQGVYILLSSFYLSPFVHLDLLMIQGVCRVESFAMSLQYCLPNMVLILWLLVLYSFIRYHDQHLPLCPATCVLSPAYDLSTAKIFRDKVFKLHGISHKVISDQGPQFISSFMKELYSQLQIEGNPSTAYHPKTDGQTEWVNAWVEQYLRLYINHRQTDWSEWLSIAKFAHNQTTSSATNFSPFILNYGQQPRSGYAQKPKHRNPAASEFIEEMKSNQQVAKSALKMAAYNMKCFHN